MDEKLAKKIENKIDEALEELVQPGSRPISGTDAVRNVLCVMYSIVQLIKEHDDGDISKQS